VFRREITGDVVTSVIVKMDALQIVDVAVAVRQLKLTGASGNTALIP